MNKILIILVFALLTFSSCGLFKKHVGDKENTKDTVVVKKDNTPKPDVNVVKKINDLKDNYLDYNYLQFKFSATYTDGKKNTPLRGLLKIHKDTAIWVSIRPGLGIELARFLLTPDSVKFINRMKSEYFAGDYKYIKKQFGIDLNYSAIQAIFTNEFFTYPASTPEAEKLIGFTSVEDDKKYTLTKTATNEKTIIDIDKNLMKLISYFSENKINGKTRDLKINYSDYKELKNTKFPNKIYSKIHDNGKIIDLEINYTKINVDKKFKASFKISPNYKRISF